MALLLPIVFAAVVLEDDDFFAAAVLHDLRGDGSTLEGWHTDMSLGIVAAEQNVERRGLRRLGRPVDARTLSFDHHSLPTTIFGRPVLADVDGAGRTLAELRFVELPGREIADGVRAGVNVSIDLERTAIRGLVYIGGSTRVEPGAVIEGPTVIGRNCVIEAGAQVRASIVGNYTRVSGLAQLSERVVRGQFCVDHRGRNVDLTGTGSPTIDHSPARAPTDSRSPAGTVYVAYAAGARRSAWYSRPCGMAVRSKSKPNPDRGRLPPAPIGPTTS